MKLDKKVIKKLLPDKFRKYCLIGICNPKYLDDAKSVYSIKNKKWSVAPRELFPALKSIIVLIHFTPVACDYKVEEIAIELGSLLWEKLGLKTHIINKNGKVDRDNLVGTEWGASSIRYDRLILLKELAYYAGLGQYGKNTLLINPRFGSDFKIQALFTEERLKYDSPMASRKYPNCKDCNQCIELCPGQALRPHKIDPLKCQWHWDEIFSKRIARPHFLYLIRLRKPKAEGYSFEYKTCRNCQTFCKVNITHYKVVS